MIKNSKVDMMVRTALFLALTFVVTFFANVPLGIGNFNLGDSMILVGALFLPCLPLGLAGGLGACFADLAGGYGAFAPFTLVIKFFEGILVALLYKYLKKVIKNQYARFLVATILGIIIMPIGYFFVNWMLFSLNEAVLALGHDFLQALFAVIIANILFYPLVKITKNIKTY